MPSVLNSQPTAAVAQTKVVCYTAPTSPATTATVIGLMLSNTSTVSQHGSAFLRRGGTDYSIITNGVIPVGNTLCCCGEDGKVVMIPGDAIVAVCDAGTMDVIVSKLEQT